MHQTPIASVAASKHCTKAFVQCLIMLEDMHILLVEYALSAVCYLKAA